MEFLRPVIWHRTNTFWGFLTVFRYPLLVTGNAMEDPHGCQGCLDESLGQLLVGDMHIDGDILVLLLEFNMYGV